MKAWNEQHFISVDNILPKIQHITGTSLVFVEVSLSVITLIFLRLVIVSTPPYWHSCFSYTCTWSVLFSKPHSSYGQASLRFRQFYIYSEHFVWKNLFCCLLGPSKWFRRWLLSMSVILPYTFTSMTTSKCKRMTIILTISKKSKNNVNDILNQERVILKTKVKMKLHMFLWYFGIKCSIN